jgi:hypothetical protein
MEEHTGTRVLLVLVVRTVAGTPREWALTAAVCPSALSTAWIFIRTCSHVRIIACAHGKEEGQQQKFTTMVVLRRSAITPEV